MQLALTAGQMKNVDLYMMQTMGIPNIVLMENAAYGVYEAVKSCSKPCVVHVYCGVGNNGGDGLGAARILLANGYDVYVIIAGEPEEMTPDTLTNFATFKQLNDRAKCIKNISELKNFSMPDADIVIDALLGTGLKRRTEGLFADLIDEINSYDNAKIISVDIPSGIQADTGAVLGNAVRANITVTFQHPKIGAYLYPGKAYIGELRVAKIGIDEGCDELRRVKIGVYDCDEPDLWIRKRRPDANKGEFGKLLLIAGSEGMAGAAVMAAQGASRAGAGLVTVAAPKEVVNVLQSSVPQATCAILSDENGKIAKNSILDIAKLIKDKTALAIGPGLGMADGVKELVENLLCDYDIPKVFDADAINAFKGNQKIFNHRVGSVIITPHPAEFARILNRDISEILADPITLATEFSKQYQLIVVLKGATTVIADPKGNARLVCGGSPGMAKGGSGDVLTGIIAGLAAQGKSILEAALLGVIIAASAGRKAAEHYGEYSMTPIDELDEIGAVMKDLEREVPDRVHEKRKSSQSISQQTVKNVKDERHDASETQIIEKNKVISEQKTFDNDNKKTEIKELDRQTEAKQKRQNRNMFGKKDENSDNRNIFSKKEENPESRNAHVKKDDNPVSEPSTERKNLDGTKIGVSKPNKTETPKQTYGSKTAEQALAEIKAKEESEMRRGTKNLNDNILDGTQEIKKEMITEIIDMEDTGDDETTPPRKPTSPTRRRIG